MNRKTIEKWAIGLMGAIINSGATAVTLVIVDPLLFDPANGGLRRLMMIMASSAAVGAALYLKQHPLPVDE